MKNQYRNQEIPGILLQIQIKDDTLIMTKYVTKGKERYV